MDGTEIDVSIGRPRLRRLENVEEWRLIVQEAKAHPSCRAEGKEGIIIIIIIVPIELLSEFSIFTVSNSVRSNPSALCAKADNGIRQFLDGSNRSMISLGDALPLYNSGYNFISSHFIFVFPCVCYVS
jgi:hypothetical protein